MEALNVSADSLLFEEHEREPTEDKLKLQFEAISKLPSEQRKIIRELIDGMIIKYESKRWQTED